MKYCTQADLESLIGVKQLAELTNDTANASTADATVVERLIRQATTMIDDKAGTVYQTPFVKVLSGTVSSSGTTLTGTGTLFTSELRPNDVVGDTSGQRRVISEITSDTAATVDTAPSPAWSGATLSAVPDTIHEIACNLAAYFCFSRRFAIMEVPKYWLDMKKLMLERLENLSDEQLALRATVTSQEALFVAPTTVPQVDFNDDSNQLGVF